jgi:hypothetical protein
MSTKQYYNDTKPGETSIESRSGAKIVMDEKGGTTIVSNLQDQNIDQLRTDNFKGNIVPNPDKNNSYLYIGKGNVDINNQGNTNQDSISVAVSADSKDIIQPIIPTPIASSLPNSEPTPSPTPTPAVSEPVAEEGVIIDREDLPSVESNSQYQFYQNTGVPEQSDTNKKLTISEEVKLLNEITGKEFKVGAITISVVNGGKLTPQAQVLLDSCKVNEQTDKVPNNAVNTAIKMNPTNYTTIVNSNLPYFQYNGVIHNIIVAKMKCPIDLFCAAGISTSFIATNGNDKAGNFPINNSSQLARSISGAIILNRNDDYNDQELTDSGVTKFNQTLNFTGGIFCVTKRDGTGHIGMVLGSELIGKVGWIYTLEFNTSGGRGNQRTGGQLALRKRKIGGSWGFTDIAFTIAPTSQYGGGKWAPNGLSKDNTYLSIGSWIKNKSFFS